MSKAKIEGCRLLFYVRNSMDTSDKNAKSASPVQAIKTAMFKEKRPHLE